MGHTFVKDTMTKNIISIDSSLTVKDAATMMADANVGCIIITKGNAPVGILTERDFVSRVVSKYLPLTTPVADVMSSPLIVIRPDDTIWEAAELMKDKKVHKLPVQEGGKLYGILTATDIVNIVRMGSESGMRQVCDQILLRLQSS